MADDEHDYWAPDPNTKPLSTKEWQQTYDKALKIVTAPPGLIEAGQMATKEAAMQETCCERFKREHPWHSRWAHVKFHVAEFLARYLRIHVDW